MSTASSVPMELVAPAVQTNPFPGLRPFREDEEYLFFGRENQVDAMIDKLASARFLAVVGASGSGKSSLVNCGLRPALHGGLMARAGTTWRIAQFRPGSDPLGALARALAQDGVLFRDYRASGLTLTEIIDTTLRMSKLGLIDIYEQARLDEGVNLLVVADQFEELFRYRQLETGQPENSYGVSEAATAFVNLLLEAKAQTTYPIYVVLTMRSDFLGDCTQFSGLAEAINAGQYLVPRMTRDERRAAIAGPVSVGGAEIAPVLLTRLVNDVGDNPDQLSILQHALNRTWACWENEDGGKGPLDLAHYEAIGTMAHALDQHAEQAYAELGGAQQIGKKLFKALTDKVTDPRGVRRPSTLRTLCALAGTTVAEVTEVIEVFREPSRSFLMPPAGEALEEDTVIDVSHESLMRVWERLKAWADEEVQSAQIYRRLADTAALHAAGKASLWRDPDLQLTLDWREKEQPTAVWAARYYEGFEQAMRFLAASVVRRDEEARELEAQRQRELETARQLAMAAEARAVAQARATAVQRQRTRIATTLLFFVLVLAVFAVIQYRWARHQSRVALAGQLAAQAELTRNQQPNLLPRSVLLAAEAMTRFVTEQVHSLEAEQSLHSGLTLLSRSVVRLPHEDSVTLVDFSPDGKRLLTAGRDHTAHVWEIASGRDLVQKHHEQQAAAVTFTHSAKAFVAVSDDHATRMLDAESGEEVARIDHEGEMTAAAFSRDGVRLALATTENDATAAMKIYTVRVWEIADVNREVMHLRHPGEVQVVAVSADGKYLATTNVDHVTRIWEIGNEQQVVRLASDSGGDALAFSPDGQYLATGGGPSARVWRVSSGVEIARLKHRSEEGDAAITGGVASAPPGDIRSVAFSPDGKYLATASDDFTARVWEIGSGREVSRIAHEGIVNTVVFSADGKYLATASWDKTAHVWEVQTGAEVVRMSHTYSVTTMHYSPDGTRVATTTSGDNLARVWDAAKTDTEVAHMTHEDTIAQVIFSPDGKLLATASGQLVRMWDADKMDTEVKSLAHKSPVVDVAFSPDGKLLATASGRLTLVWDATSGWETSRKEYDNMVTSVVFSPDGKYLVAVSGADVWVHESPNGEMASHVTHSPSVNAVAISPDGAYLATITEDFTARVWRMTTGEEITHLDHGDLVTAITFSADGKYLATASGADARIWEVPSGHIVARITHEQGVNTVAFSVDGNSLATGGTDGVVRVWRWRPEDLVVEVCARLPRNLTSEEWRLYLGEEPYHKTCPNLP